MNSINILPVIELNSKINKSLIIFACVRPAKHLAFEIVLSFAKIRTDLSYGTFDVVAGCEQG